MNATKVRPSHFCADFSSGKHETLTQGKQVELIASRYNWRIVNPAKKIELKSKQSIMDDLFLKTFSAMENSCATKMTLL